jgi:hypothetical protein
LSSSSRNFTISLPVRKIGFSRADLRRAVTGMGEPDHHQFAQAVRSAVRQSGLVAPRPYLVAESIEKLNGPFLFEERGSPAKYLAGLDLAIARGCNPGPM